MCAYWTRIFNKIVSFKKKITGNYRANFRQCSWIFYDFYMDSPFVLSITKNRVSKTSRFCLPLLFSYKWMGKGCHNTRENESTFLTFSTFISWLFYIILPFLLDGFRGWIIFLRLLWSKSFLSHYYYIIQRKKVISHWF